eukprot:CAMPEP_0172299748 /NCGR_PEP_ID=MMETSP1058-20130122/1983_1 /TAXON_ID=83371 /ORGANISM="Detonula confervacea, Strain CCMP 353" /LENGTH=444 /DNA_ID=CAMNT_0013009303 /DNA_START=361 /DNA_END=1695 /DNA_ORIENTATION=+
MKVPGQARSLSDEEIAEVVKKYGRKRPASASLETLLKTGRGELLSKNSTIQEAGDSESFLKIAEEKRVLIQIANFLRRELPVRLAHRIQDLSSVPLLRDMDSTKAVKQIYIDSLLQLSSVPSISTPEQEEEYAAELEKLYSKHSSVLIQMAKGAYELRKQMRKGNETENNGQQTKQSPGREFERMQHCHSFLDRFYMSRIGIRVLAGQYLALRQQQKTHSDPADPNNDYMGIICKATSPHQIVLHAADDATWMCQRRYGDAPEVIVSGNLDLTFPYIPTHLHYILLELLKNAMRATMEKHCGQDDKGDDFYTGTDVDVPPINVVIADALENEDVVIKISDEGGGIPRSNVKQIWSYLFTTASPSIQEKLVAFGDGGASNDDNNGAMQDHSIHSPLAGLGYGLPISRSYAQYFGGDLSIVSMEGYGTDCFLHLRRLGNSREPLVV